MPELNVLPVNASKNIELKDELLPFNSTTSNDDFSKYIDLHLNENDNFGRGSNVDAGKSETKLSKQSASSIDPKLSNTKPDDLLEKNNSKDNINSELVVQEVAASGKKYEIKPNKIDQNSVLESEELISFLSKAENTLKNTSNSQPIDILASISSTEKLSAEAAEARVIEKNTYYEAQLLLNSSHLATDLSPIAKALGNEEVGSPISPILIQKTDLKEELVPNFVIEEVDNKVEQVTITVEGTNKGSMQAEVPVDLIKSVENKVAINKLGIETNNVLTELEHEINTEINVSHIIDNKTNTEIEVSNKMNKALVDQESEVKINTQSTDSDKKNIALFEVKTESITDTKAKISQNTLKNTLSAEVLINDDLVSKNKEEAFSSTAENKAVGEIDLDQVKVEIETKKTSENTLLTEKTQRFESEELRGSQFTENKLSDSSNVSKALSNAAKSPEKIIGTQGNISKTIQTDTVSILSDLQVTENDLTQNSESTDITEETNQTTFFNRTTTQSNQSTTNDLIKDEINKGQAKDSEKGQLSAALDEQIKEEPVVQNKDATPVGTKGVEGVEGVKRESLPSSHFIDVSGKATQVTQDIIDQQSTERVNPSSLTEVTNSQKINAQLHQETISLFRKDFSEAVKDKVMIMISQKLQRFDITLDPPELGNMQVKVNLQGEQAVVNFIVQSQQTKDALEQNMHKLRESLTEQGVEVGDASVEQQSQQSANEENGGDGSTNQNNNNNENEKHNISEANDVIAHTLSAQMINSSTATVDYYA